MNPHVALSGASRGGWEDMESQILQRYQDLHWFFYSPAARGHGFRWGGLTLGQVFLIIPIRARAHGGPQMPPGLSSHKTCDLSLHATQVSRRGGAVAEGGSYLETGLP